MPSKMPKKVRGIPLPTDFSAPGAGTMRRYPKTFTPGLAQRICRSLMMGKSLKATCEQKGMPTVRTVVGWLANPNMVEFREQYYYARRIAAEILVDEIMEIADDTSKDWKPRFGKDGEIVDYIPDNEAIQRSRTRIDTRKWYAAKMLPRVYGDKIDVELEAKGDLAELLKKAANNDTGIPSQNIPSEETPS